MNEITPFDFNGSQVRVVLIDGEPWWVAGDVCKVIEISNTRDAVSRLDDDEKDAVDSIDSIGRTQRMTVINESGLYSLVMTSRKPEAKAFKRWVTSEVLPQIRKTGAYTRKLDPELARIVDLTLEIQATRDKQRELEIEQARMASELSTVASEQAKLAEDVADLRAISPLTNSDALTLRDAAHAVTGGKLGQNNFAKWLADHGIRFQDHNGNWRCHQDWIQRELAVESFEQWQNGQGWSWVTRFTARGIAKLTQLWNEEE